MTLYAYAFGVKTVRKMLNIAAFLKFKMAAEDTLEQMEATQVCSLK